MDIFNVDVSSPEIWFSFLALAFMEIVLGIDNILFISILVAQLPAARQFSARVVGLSFALVLRVLFLMGVVWLTRLVEPVVEVAGMAFSWRDLILLAGGVFLIGKATTEIHGTVESREADTKAASARLFGLVIVQIVLLDLVFSVDSVLTAIGMSDVLGVMVAAVFVAIVVMLVASGPLSRFIERHPTTKMLALAFLLIIGIALVADGLEFHIPRGYLYFAIVFSAFVEFLNLLRGQRRKPGKNPSTLQERRGG
ncbi:Membrane protein TerC, possibly involved in tellurium resistance [Methylomagnum ishizawai]|uniref:Membrane protein TerC, possibly involved in tellurium resistance n=1 Tax=Methylomagnum ishizawai TaxID=1760988 RepID=A0A1Y6CV09_9GAMM|nr:TerC family protein [Methylomagnum ishizawai]SMF94468.1 Membrane protein TerC, possibly involved in tellurium resistance [Methylomagnum ishizawai]